MPRLQAKHRTEIRYAGPVGQSVNEVRLTPGDHPRQRVEWARLRVEPSADLVGHTDVFGNTVLWFQLVERHQELAIESEAIVDTGPVAPPNGTRGDFGDLAAPAYREPAAEFLFESPQVRWGDSLRELAGELALDEGGGVREWLAALEAGVNAAVAYTPGVTRVDTPVEEVLRARRGVCQDLAHVMIAVCRTRGVAARYVSGWLHQPDAEGPGESHAWIEALVPGDGWVELDPTHPAPRHERYVRLATGRDYSDVPPLRGSYLGPATEEMIVTVDVHELPS